MSISQTTQKESPNHHLFCPQCNALLPLRATFCGSCGERVKRKKQAAVLDEQDINSRYRITTLVRRRPHVNLYFAQDTLQASVNDQPRMVAIRDIELADLDTDTKTEALALAQQEYDRLRRWHIPHILASMEMRVFQEHLFLISGMPFLPREAATSQSASRLYTLQDFLQSGQGLPKEARALAWMRGLCQAVERLHRQHIVLGDLDPYTVVLNKNCAEAEPRLMISWVQPDIQKLLAPPSELSAPLVSYFSAPEALAGAAEVRSDVYSLGALLYLLLTGTPPDESTLRHRRRLRSPRELNARINAQLDECVMQALTLDPNERFTSAATLMAALEQARLHVIPPKLTGSAVQPSEANADDAETVRIIPLLQKDTTRLRTAAGQVAIPQTHGEPLAPVTTPVPQDIQASIHSHVATQKESTSIPTTPDPVNTQPGLDARQSVAKRQMPPPPLTPAVPGPVWKQRITGILPALKLEAVQAPSKLVKPKKARTKPTEPKPASVKQSKTTSPALESKPVPAKQSEPPSLETNEPTSTGENSLLKQMQQLLIGQQQHVVEAAAIIETPIRVRPDQSYQLRMHIVGRDGPAPHPNAKKGVLPTGLSALAQGEAVQVEVRSVLQQGYTYILQHATVTIPAHGYAAEVTIPMQPHPQPGVVTGRRERLHVFFLDSQRRPLYEKPFVVEVFVSPLVQVGREGHHVLPIPF